MRTLLVALLLLGTASAQTYAEVTNEDDDEIQYEYVETGDPLVVMDVRFETRSQATFGQAGVVIDGQGEYGGNGGNYDPGSTGNYGQYSGNYPEGDYGNVFVSELLVGFNGVFEFEDQDGDGAFNPEVDEIVRQHSLVSCWDPIQLTDEDPIRFTASCDMGAMGTFRIDATVRTNPGLDTKLDFIFEDVTYESSSSNIALVLNVEGSTVDLHGSTGDSFAGESGVTIRGGKMQSYFTWAPTALVDGVSMPVMDFQAVEGQTVEGEGGSVYESYGGVTLAYGRGAEIVHDPRIGTQYGSSGKGSPGLPLILVGGALLLAGRLRR